MHKLFTSEDVIRFAYNEMPADEAAEFCIELAGCPETAAELKDITDARNVLDGSSFKPRAGVINSILNYSKALIIQKESSIGSPLEVVLN
jgi:hypothetical protein